MFMHAQMKMVWSTNQMSVFFWDSYNQEFRNGNRLFWLKNKEVVERTNSLTYGAEMDPNRPIIEHEPMPMFLMTVGTSSAVYT